MEKERDEIEHAKFEGEEGSLKYANGRRIGGLICHTMATTLRDNLKQGYDWEEDGRSELIWVSTLQIQLNFAYYHSVVVIRLK